MLSLRAIVSCGLGETGLLCVCGGDLLDGPGQRAHNIDAIFVDALEHLAEEVLVVEGAFEVVALGFDGLEGTILAGGDVGTA